MWKSLVSGVKSHFEMDFTDDNTLYFSFLFLRFLKRRRKFRGRKTRLWAKDIFLQRESRSAYYIFLQEIRLNDRQSHFR